jgi:hypothetical protein
VPQIHHLRFASVIAATSPSLRPSAGALQPRIGP